jgi:hypothetical protein
MLERMADGTSNWNAMAETQVHSLKDNSHDTYGRAVMLFVYANLISAFISELRGDGHLGLIGSFNLWSTDLAVLAGFPMLWLACHKPQRPFGLLRVVVLVWTAIAVMWLVRAVAVDAFQGAYTFRRFACFFQAVFALGLRPVAPSIARKISRAFIITGLWLAGLLALRLTLGSTFMVRPDSGNLWSYTTDGRPMMTFAATILGQSLLFAVAHRWFNPRYSREAGRWDLLIVAVLLCAVLATGQRTSAAASIAGVLVWLAFSFRIRLVQWLSPSRVSIIILIAVISHMVGVDGLMDLLPDTFSAGNAKADFGIRVLIWGAVVRNVISWSLFSQLFGKPDTWNLIWYFGSAWREGNIVDARSPHNEYFGAVLFVGIIGVALILTFIGGSMIGAARARLRKFSGNTSGISAGVVAGLVTILLIYGISYEWMYEQGIIVGLCAAGWKRVFEHGTWKPDASS